MKISHCCLLWLAMLLAPALCQAAFVAADVPFGTVGTQNYNGSLGLRFTVNTPIDISELGVFDDSSNGINGPLGVQIYEFSTQTLIPGTTTTFDSGSPGVFKSGGMRYKTLAAPVRLPTGNYVVSAYGYNAAELNGNVGPADNANTLNTGGGLISFPDKAQYGAPAAFPGTVDASPNQYRAGSFVFDAAPPTNIAYDIPAPIGSNQNYGALGLDFHTNSPIQINRFGAFDANGDGFIGTLTVQLWQITGGPTQVGPTVTFTGTSQQLLGGSRFQTLASPLTLPAGNDYSIVIYGTEGPDGNFNSNGAAGPSIMNSLGGAISFIGLGRYTAAGGGLPGTFPTGIDGGPANRYGAATFDYQVVPEPASVALLALGSLALFVVGRRRVLEICVDLRNLRIAFFAVLDQSIRRFHRFRR